jgi:hypothetical protein
MRSKQLCVVNDKGIIDNGDFRLEGVTIRLLVEDGFGGEQYRTYGDP